MPFQPPIAVSIFGWSTSIWDFANKSVSWDLSRR